MDCMKLFEERDTLAVEGDCEYGYETLHQAEKEESLEIISKKYEEDETNKYY